MTVPFQYTRTEAALDLKTHKPVCSECLRNELEASQKPVFCYHFTRSRETKENANDTGPLTLFTMVGESSLYRYEIMQTNNLVSVIYMELSEEIFHGPKLRPTHILEYGTCIM